MPSHSTAATDGGTYVLHASFSVNSAQSSTLVGLPAWFCCFACLDSSHLSSRLAGGTRLVGCICLWSSPVVVTVSLATVLQGWFSATGVQRASLSTNTSFNCTRSFFLEIRDTFTSPKKILKWPAGHSEIVFPLFVCVFYFYLSTNCAIKKIRQTLFIPFTEGQYTTIANPLSTGLFSKPADCGSVATVKM